MWNNTLTRLKIISRFVSLSARASFIWLYFLFISLRMNNIRSFFTFKFVWNFSLIFSCSLTITSNAKIVPYSYWNEKKNTEFFEKKTIFSWTPVINPWWDLSYWHWTHIHSFCFRNSSKNQRPSEDLVLLVLALLDFAVICRPSISSFPLREFLFLTHRSESEIESDLENPAMLRIIPFTTCRSMNRLVSLSIQLKSW